MPRHPLRLAACAAGLAAPFAACANPDTDALRAELAATRAAYERRIADLEARLERVEARAAPDASAATGPAVASPPAGGTAFTATAFNPAISLILDGKYAAYARSPESYALPGFQLGGEAGLAREGFGVGESELIASANIDPYFYGQLTAAVHQEEGGGTEFELEEAFFDTLALPAGFTLRGGRFFSGVGYLNSRHAHTWDFADATLPQRAFLGNNFFDDGVQLRYLAPTPFLLELGAEVLRGDSFPAAGADDSGSGARSAFVHAGWDLGASHSLRVGASRLWADARGRSGGGHAHGHDDEDGHVAEFSGNSDLTILDLVWKWAPDGNPRERNASLVAEFYDRDEDGLVTLEEGGMTELSTYRGEQRGWSVHGTWQFRPRWRAGLRHDRLWADNRGSDADVLTEAGLADGDDPRRWSAMLEWNPSEFSRVRMQYNRDHSTGTLDHQWLLQYVLSLGAHGAHTW
jgi:hypothetical protein